jgi:DNA/RNA endonuclease G (NUC1)
MGVNSQPVSARRGIVALVCVLALLFSSLSARALIGVEYQMQLGNPSNATADTNNHSHFLIQRTVEALDYNDSLGQPNWASWNLTASDIGTVERSSFITDTNLPANFYRVKSSDYDNAGYDRGHLCPSKDRTDTVDNNDLVFLMSNILPQWPANNSGVWLQFENFCRALVQSTNNFELLITSGGSGYSGQRINTNGPVLIPDYVWKIVVVVPQGPGTATNRIAATNRVIALKIPNDVSATNDWQFYVTSANQIQVDTGLTFFSALDSEIATALRAKVDGATNPPPAIFTFSPTNGAVGTAVTILGTNFFDVSAVALNGATTSFTLNSSNQITAIVPTNAGSGFLSITTPSGTAISANPLTVLTSEGGTIYSGVLAGWDVSTLTGGLNNYGPSPFTPTTNASNITIGGLTRGSGVRTSGTATAQGWGGTSFTNMTLSSAIASNRFVSFTVTANTGYAVSFSEISRFDYYRSATAPTSGTLQFQVGSGAFNDITNLSYPTISTADSISPIDLSNIAALQNITSNTPLTFRIANYGGTSSAGTWYLYNTGGDANPDLELRGTITQIIDTSAAPVLSSASFANNQFTFTLTGTSDRNYIIQSTINLSAPNWISIATNAAPFTFTNSNAGPLRFYRAIAAP